MPIKIPKSHLEKIELTLCGIWLCTQGSGGESQECYILNTGRGYKLIYYRGVIL